LRVCVYVEAAGKAQTTSRGACMAEAKHWYVICYDITEPKRWRMVYKKLHGYGRRLQYSIFRCRLTVRQMERLHWELEEMLTAEDRLLNAWCELLKCRH
jgi:CRISPR-associated protein Cas2